MNPGPTHPKTAKMVNSWSCLEMAQAEIYARMIAPPQHGTFASRRLGTHRPTLTIFIFFCRIYCCFVQKLPDASHFM
jgi:hypothetical protein